MLFISDLFRFPRFLPICSDLFLGIPRFVLICSDLFQNKSEQIWETPSCRPLLQVPTVSDPVFG